jgi:hypothetical protein
MSHHRSECLHGTGAMLADPEDLIVTNLGPRAKNAGSSSAPDKK